VGCPLRIYLSPSNDVCIVGVLMVTTFLVGTVVPIQDTIGPIVDGPRSRGV
jgi:hypothetical protein